MPFEQLWSHPKPLIAVLHLPPLIGSPAWVQAGGPALSELLEPVERAASAFEAAGYHALILENFGDSPFYPQTAPPETLASMALLGHAVRDHFQGPLGINVLRNDGRSALALAVALEAQFIRVNILSGVAATDQGLISARAHELLRERERLLAGPQHDRSVFIFADVHVKHARPLAEQDLATAAKDLVMRAGADAVVVSGRRTGEPCQQQDLKAVTAALAGRAPVFIGSGLSLENLDHLGPHCDGAIVASSILEGGRAGQAVDPKRAQALLERWNLTASSHADVYRNEP